VSAVAGFFQRRVGIGGGFQIIARPYGEFDAAFEIVFAAFGGQPFIGILVERFFCMGKQRQ
jgi:hypothetical protein